MHSHFLLALLLCTAPLITHAQSAYPSKTIRLIVPVTTGGPSDLVARIVGDKLATSMGRPVIIENRPGASHPDLITNRITFMIDPLAASAPHIKSGSLRALAVTTPQRNPSFPNVPTAIEAGVPGYDFASWGGVFAPANLPREVMQKLNAEITRRFDDMGLVAKASSPEEFRAFLQSEMTRWKGVLGAKKP